MPDEIMKAFGPAIGQAPIPPVPASTPIAAQIPLNDPNLLYPAAELPELLPEAGGTPKPAESAEQDEAAPPADASLSESGDTDTGAAPTVPVDVEILDDSVEGAATTVASAPIVGTIPTVPEVVHDTASTERKMAQEQMNYLTMLPPMAKNLLATVLTEEHQLFLSDTKNQNPIKAMSFFMTKEGREAVRAVINMYIQYCKQFD